MNASNIAMVALIYCSWLGADPDMSALSGKERELFDFVRSAHVASRDLIRTCSCRVEFTNTVIGDGTRPPLKQSASGLYWYSPDAIRLEAIDKEAEKETERFVYVWKDGIRRVIDETEQSSGTQKSAGIQAYPNRFLHRCDGWFRALFAFQQPLTTGAIQFEQVVAKAVAVKKVQRTSLRGKEMVLARLSFEGRLKGVETEADFYFDPTVNYLVRKHTYRTFGPSSEAVNEEEVLEYKECVPGLYFPVRTAGQSYSNGKLWTTREATISDVRLNEKLPDRIFQLPFPAGIQVGDLVRGESYYIDAAGNPISKPIKLSTAPVPPPPLPEGHIPVPGTESLEEPGGITRWLLPVSLSMLVLAAVAAALRRWRTRKNGG